VIELALLTVSSSPLFKGQPVPNLDPTTPSTLARLFSLFSFYTLLLLNRSSCTIFLASSLFSTRLVSDRTGRHYRPLLTIKIFKTSDSYGLLE